MLGDSGLVFVVLVVILLVTLVAGALLVGGGPFHRTPEEMLTQPAIVAPFTGLPPDGAPASDPETGELVVGFYGRIASIGMEAHSMWLYADGRLIWKRNLDGVTAGGRAAFGDVEPTRAVIEQHLTPEGVELVRSEVMAAAVIPSPVPTTAHPYAAGPGVLWGGLTVRVGDQTLRAGWWDSRLPTMLADPGSWLPGTAWADRRLGGYVPTRYAVCLSDSEPLDRLPASVSAVLVSRAAPMAADGDPPQPCYEVATEVAREIAAALDGAGLHAQVPPAHGLWYTVPGATGSLAELDVLIMPIVPNGDIVCYCG